MTDGRAGAIAGGAATALERWLPVAAGLLLALAAFGIYMVTQQERLYDHFVWQATSPTVIIHLRLWRSAKRAIGKPMTI